MFCLYLVNDLIIMTLGGGVCVCVCEHTVSHILNFGVCWVLVVSNS